MTTLWSSRIREEKGAGYIAGQPANRSPCATGVCDTRPPILRDMHENPVSQRHRCFFFAGCRVAASPRVPGTRNRRFESDHPD